jgi:endonuclease/exonuclease/phosphatase family metal-dependent hydrolase
VLAALVSVCAPVMAQAQTTVVLDAPDSESIDTVVRGGAYASTNYGSGVLLTRASSDASYVRRSLMKFDTETRIPARATITSARLTMTVKSGGSEARRLAAYRIVNSFDERYATWTRRKSGYNWSKAGGDLGSKYAEATVNGPGTKVTFDVTRLVQEAVNGNFGSRWTRIGVLDPGSASSGSYREYYSSETSTASLRPTLTVVYGGGTTTSTSGSTSTSSTSTSSTSATLRVLHWNVHHGGVGTDGRYDPGRIAKWIATMNPHVASLNEVDTTAQLDAIVNALKSRTGVTWYKSFSGRGNAIISRLRLDAVSKCLYAPSYSAYGAHGSVVINGRRVNIWSSHLHVSSASARLAETKAVQACASNWSESRILAGDYNMQAGSTEYNASVTNYKDAWLAAKAIGKATNYSGNCDGCTRNSRIDYVFTSKGASYLVLSGARIYDTRDSYGKMPSDHKPMLVTYTVR